MAQKKALQNREHAWKAFNRDIKSDSLGGLVLLCGRELFLIDWAVNSIKDKYISKVTETMDYTRINDGREVTADIIIESCETLSLMSEMRVVVIRDFPLLEKSGNINSTDEDKLISYFKKIPESVILIFLSESPNKVKKFYKAIKKCGKVYDFDILDEAYLKSFVEKRFRNSGKIITGPLINQFIHTSGYFTKESEYTLLNMENDIKKITAHSSSDKISATDIEAATAGSPETNVFAITDALAAGRKQQVYIIIDNYYSAGGVFYKLLGLLISQFEIIYIAKELLTDGCTLKEISSMASINSFRLQKAMPLVNKYSLKQLSNILMKAYGIDAQIKSGDIEASMALELFIAEL